IEVAVHEMQPARLALYNFVVTQSICKRQAFSRVSKQTVFFVSRSSFTGIGAAMPSWVLFQIYARAAGPFIKYERACADRVVQELFAKLIDCLFRNGRGVWVGQDVVKLVVGACECNNQRVRICCLQ